MLLIFKYYLLQFKNYLKNLSLRIKLEIIALLIIFYAFFTETLIKYFNQLLSEAHITSLELTSLAQHILLLLFALSTPFIYINLIPRQKGFHILRIQPLSSSGVLGVLIIYFLKYQSIILIIAAPVFTAIAITSGFGDIFIFSVGILFLPIIYLILTHMLSSVVYERTRVIIHYFTLQSLYFLCYYFLYSTKQFYAFLPIAAIFLFTILVIPRRNMLWLKWDKTLQRFIPADNSSKKPWQKVKYNTFPKIVPESIHPFFVKEVLAHLRNVNYMRLKIVSLVLFITILIILDFYFEQNYESIFMLVCIVFIWLHYSHQFNEKYIRSEPVSFIKTAPFNFYQIWLGKFFTEFLIIFAYLFIILVALIFHGSGWSEIMQVIAFFLLFSIFLLATIIIFRLLFYDNVRKAGYAYHFMIIFSLVMLINRFYLVAPFITLTLLIYFGYLSYRQFAG